MWRDDRGGNRNARLRARLLRCASVLAIAAASVVLAPGFDEGQIPSDGEGIELSWPGTSAFAKRRRHYDGSGNVNTYGSFSSGTSSNGSGLSSGASGGSGSNNSSSSSNSSNANASGGSEGGNARNDNNSNSNSNSNSSSNGNNSRSSGSRGRDDDQGGSSGNSGQPATLADTLKSLFDNPSASKSAGNGVDTSGSIKSAPKSSLGAPATVTPAAAAPVTPKGPRGVPVTSGSSAVVIGHNDHVSSEILGVRLSSKALGTLQGMGFGVPAQPKTAFDVLLLTTPPGMTSDQAQSMLRQAMPKEKFETNKFYRNYQTRSSTGNAHSVTDASPRQTCTGSRCLPRDLIKWSPENLSGCSAGVAVGVLDTGLDVNHPAFTRPITNSFIPPGRAPAPAWHGTAVYALLAGNRNSGTPGLIPNATLYHGNVFYSDASGEFATDTHVLLAALDWMDRANVKIVNMSFAGPRDQLLEEAIAKLSAKGMIFVAAVGNEGPTAEPAYPAAYRQVIAVTAIKPDRRIYPFANRGRHIDVAAPGVDIWSAVPGAREGYFTGTSFAAPFVTALVATLYRENPTPVKEKLLARLDYDDLGLPGRDSTYGRGLALAPRNCAPAPLVAETPAPPPSWGTTSIDKASTRPPSAPTVSAGFR